VQADLYAVAALAGAAVVVVASELHLSADAAVLVGAALCFGLRVLAMEQGWQLPKAQAPLDDVPPRRDWWGLHGPGRGEASAAGRREAR
jgi:hypothetical protein